MPKAVDRFVGARLQWLRQRHSMTVEALAAEAGLSVGELQRIENGGHAPAHKLAKLATALAVDLRYFFDTRPTRSDRGIADIARLVEVFAQIEDPQQRSRVIAFARSLARGEPTTC